MAKRSSLAAAFSLMTVISQGASAQAPRIGGQPAQNPNVPAITGDRQAVPKPRADDPAMSSTHGSSTGLVNLAQRPQLREYALKHRDKEARLTIDVKVGATLPTDAALMDIPPEFGLSRYRLALANQKTLLVDPRSRRIEEVID